MRPRILLVEDDIAARFGFVRFFSHEGYVVSEASGLQDAMGAVTNQRFDAIVIDVNLPDGNGISLIDKVRVTDTIVPIIVITGSGDIPLAVEAMRRGADNFLVKPVDNAGLAVFLQKCLEVGSLKRHHDAQHHLNPQDNITFGSSSSIRGTLEQAAIAASNDCPVLITGETGSGKGKLAAWMHRNSPRSRYEFVEVNCSGLRGEILLREIFGNVRGAFTSADKDRKGLLDLADGGTLFLDEIGDMDLTVQAQFLKVLEEKSYRRLGDVKLVKSDFRLICATNRDIQEMVNTGQFRQDLLYRINLICLHLAPLRERLADLPELIAQIMHSLGAPEITLPEEVMALFFSYPWPGNLRELKNILERARILAQGNPLKAEHFTCLSQQISGSESAARPVHQTELARISAVWQQCGGDVAKAMQMLDLSRATLYRKLKQIRKA